MVVAHTVAGAPRSTQAAVEVVAIRMFLPGGVRVKDKRVAHFTICQCCIVVEIDRARYLFGHGTVPGVHNGVALDVQMARAGHTSSRAETAVGHVPSPQRSSPRMLKGYVCLQHGLHRRGKSEKLMARTACRMITW